MSDYTTIKGLDRVRYEALLNAEILHPLPQNAVLVIGADWCPDTQHSIMDSGYPTQTKDGRPIVYLNDANPEAHKILRTLTGNEILGGGVDSELPPMRPTRQYNYPTVLSTRDGALTGIIFADTVPEGGLLYPTELGNLWQKKLEERAKQGDRPTYDAEKAAPLFTNSLARPFDDATFSRLEAISKIPDVRKVLEILDAKLPVEPSARHGAQLAKNQLLEELSKSLELPSDQVLETLHKMAATRTKLIGELPDIFDPNQVYAVVSSNCGHCHELLARSNYPRTTEDGRPITYLNLASDAEGKPQNPQAYAFYMTASLKNGVEIEGYPTYVTTNDKGKPSVAAAGPDPILEQFFPKVVTAETARQAASPAPVEEKPATAPLEEKPATAPPGLANALGALGITATPIHVAQGPALTPVERAHDIVARNA